MSEKVRSQTSIANPKAKPEGQAQPRADSTGQATTRNASVRTKSEGQAIVEFIMMIGVATMFAVMMNQSLQQITGSMWKVIYCEVSAPCPTCIAPTAVKGVTKYFSKCR